jgi:hypothetical protein
MPRTSPSSEHFGIYSSTVVAIEMTLYFASLAVKDLTSKPELWSLQLLGNGSVNTPVTGQWLSSHHVITTTDMHATTEELLEVVPLCSLYILTTTCHRQ